MGSEFNKTVNIEGQVGSSIDRALDILLQLEKIAGKPITPKIDVDASSIKQLEKVRKEIDKLQKESVSYGKLLNTNKTDLKQMAKASYEAYQQTGEANHLEETAKILQAYKDSGGKGTVKIDGEDLFDKADISAAMGDIESEVKTRISTISNLKGELASLESSLKPKTSAAEDLGRVANEVKDIERVVAQLNKAGTSGILKLGTEADIDSDLAEKIKSSLKDTLGDGLQIGSIKASLSNDAQGIQTLTADVTAYNEAMNKAVTLRMKFDEEGNLTDSDRINITDNSERDKIRAQAKENAKATATSSSEYLNSIKKQISYEKELYKLDAQNLTANAKTSSINDAKISSLNKLIAAESEYRDGLEKTSNVEKQGEAILQRERDILKVRSDADAEIANIENAYKAYENILNVQKQLIQEKSSASALTDDDAGSLKSELSTLQSSFQDSGLDQYISKAEMARLANEKLGDSLRQLKTDNSGASADIQGNEKLFSQIDTLLNSKKTQQLTSILPEELINPVGLKEATDAIAKLQNLSAAKSQGQLDLIDAKDISEAQELVELVQKSQSLLDKGNLRNTSKGTFSGAFGSVDELRNQITLQAEANKQVLEYKNLSQKGGFTTITYSLRDQNGALKEMVSTYDELTQKAYTYQRSEKEYVSQGDKFFSTIKTKATELAGYISIMDIFQKVKSFVSNGVDAVRDFDTAMTELRKTSSGTADEYANFLDTVQGSAVEVGSTSQLLTESAADWSRLGYNLQDSATMAKNTAILMNVSEFENVSDATNSMISIMQAYGKTADESMEIIDKLNMVNYLPLCA